MVIMTACAMAQEITVDELIIAYIKAGVRCDAECFESDCKQTLEAWIEGEVK